MCRELHIRYRDLLALDPSVPLPCPATLLIRWAARGGLGLAGLLEN